MSTAGKVLTVLILLVMMAWIVMLSAVTQLNVNWQTRIAKAEKDLESAKTRLADNTAKALDLTDKTRAEQAAKDLDLREIQGRTAAAEARQSSKTEDLTRVQIQAAAYQAALQRAEVNLATRTAEKAKTQEDLAAKKVEIAKKQDENNQLRDQLAKLQDDFKRLLTNNAKQLDKDGNDRPTPRSASDRRPSPSS